MKTSGVPLPASKTRTLAPRLVSILRTPTLIGGSSRPVGPSRHPVRVAAEFPSAYTTTGYRLSILATCCEGAASLSRRIAYWSGAFSSLACCPHGGDRKCDQRAIL